MFVSTEYVPVDVLTKIPFEENTLSKFVPEIDTRYPSLVHGVPVTYPTPATADSVVKDEVELSAKLKSCPTIEEIFAFHVEAEAMYASSIAVAFHVPVATVPSVVMLVEPDHVLNAVFSTLFKPKSVVVTEMFPDKA